VETHVRSEALLEGLTPAQKDAVTTAGAPLCILAAAGAGKTRVLTRRIAYRAATGTASPQHTLALTFTRKAATELQQRLGRLGMRERVIAGTFHAVASAQLHRWWADRQQPAPTLLERKGGLLASLASARSRLAGVPVADLAGHIEWAKARLVPPDRFAQAVTEHRRSLPPKVNASDLATLYERYENEKRRRGLVDFDDLLSGCAQAIESDPDFAAAQRWRWRHVFVDEFQDLNPLQHRLLLAWLGTSLDLCVVGDPHQAIYGWNGSDPELLARLPQRWPGATVIHLDANHRCTEQVVAAAAGVLGRAGSSLRAAGRVGPLPVVRAYASDGAEARGVASGLQRAHAEGRPWRSLAVLTRTNAQLVPVQKALAAAGIPCWAPSQAAVLDDPVARRVLLDIRRERHRPIQAVVADLEEMAAGGPDALHDGPDDASRGALTVLLELAVAFATQEPLASAGAWLAWLPSASRSSTETGSPGDTVTLCSFHRAKGLEWDAVWVAGLERGLVPISRATAPHEEAEERRLLYVALTRAATQLHCSWSRQRVFGNRSLRRDPSPWLDLLVAGRPPVRGGPHAADHWRRQLAEQRLGLRDAARTTGRQVRRRMPTGWPDPDADTVASLRSWRLETARTSGVPAYVILHDSTLEALASLRPKSTEELLDVPGLGPVKANRYGPSLLSIVAERVASA
jgi:DNA helicase-2/ATP-dependent DNA helicase PcrA